MVKITVCAYLLPMALLPIGMRINSSELKSEQITDVQLFSNMEYDKVILFQQYRQMKRRMSILYCWHFPSIICDLSYGSILHKTILTDSL